MRMYEVEIFNGIPNNDNKPYENGFYYKSRFIVKESDLKRLEEIGGGFNRLKYIGDLFIVEPEGINVKINAKVEGLEKANILAKELKNTLDSMELKFKIKDTIEELTMENDIEQYTSELKSFDCTPTNIVIENIIINKDTDIKSLAESIKNIGTKG